MKLPAQEQCSAMFVSFTCSKSGKVKVQSNGDDIDSKMIPISCIYN